MAINQQINGASIYVPGAYSKLKVALVGAKPLLETGNVAIIGEAEAGEPGSSASVVQFSNSEMASIINIYKSGPIVDAARALINPSNDTKVVNGASRVFIYKTNASTKADLDLSTGFGTLNCKEYGQKGNLVAVTINKENGTAASVTSSATFDVSGGNFQQAQVFGIRVSGGAVNSFTFPAGVLDATTLNNALANGTNWSSGLPSGITFTASGVATAVTMVITFSADNADHRYGYSKSFELINTTGTPLTAMNITTGLKVASIEPKMQFKVERSYDEIDENSDDNTGDIGGDYYLEVGYFGTTGTVTINSTKLTTTVTGGSGTNLDLSLSDFATLNDLVDYIDSQLGYSCSINANLNGALTPSVLDRVTSAGICSSTALTKPGKIKADAYLTYKWFNDNSSIVELSRTSYCGLPDPQDKTFLSGGVKGASSNSNFTAGLADLEGYDVDLIVPLVSQDATDDLVEDPAYTDASSNYTIDSILSAVKNHCKKMCGTKFRKERQAYLGYRGTLEECKTAALTLNSENVSLIIQDCYAFDTTGTLKYMQPHISASFVAGMHAGAEVGQPVTRKYINVSGIRHVKKQAVTPSATELFDPKVSADTAIINGILPLLNPSSGGFRVIVQNSTYSKDSSFIYNRPSVLSAAYYVAKNFRAQLEDIFVGEKNKSSTPSDIYNQCIAILSSFLRADIIVADDTNNGLGYKDLTLTVDGSTVYITVTIVPVQGVDFIISDITVDTIRKTIS